MLTLIRNAFSATRVAKRAAVTTRICHSAHPQRKMSSSLKQTANRDSAIVWMDMEMTGLDVEKDKIIEVACLITDENLCQLTKGLDFAIRYPQEVFDNMDEWCKQHHNASGLVQRCLESDVTPEKAESMLLAYLEEHVPKGKCPLAGNTIYMDRFFLHKNWPRVNDYLHYRIIDVSTIKELCKRWNPAVTNATPKKKLAHRSLDDIKESIEELKYYRREFFKTTPME